MAYYARFGPISGPIRAAAGYYGIGVLQAREISTPIGVALAAGRDQDGRALWQLTIDTIEMPGLYVVIDREFRPADERRASLAHRSGGCDSRASGRVRRCGLRFQCRDLKRGRGTSQVVVSRGSGGRDPRPSAAPGSSLRPRGRVPG